MVITDLEEKGNKKHWIPIQGGKKPIWQTFQWSKIRQIPIIDREMYMQNLVNIETRDKISERFKEDSTHWKNKISTRQILSRSQCESFQNDQQRMKAALGIAEKKYQQKRTPAQMLQRFKIIGGNKNNQALKPETNQINFGDKRMKKQIKINSTAMPNNSRLLEKNWKKIDDKLQKHQLKKKINHKIKQNKEIRQQTKERKRKKNRQKNEERSRSRQQNSRQNNNKNTSLKIQKVIQISIEPK